MKWKDWGSEKSQPFCADSSVKLVTWREKHWERNTYRGDMDAPNQSKIIKIQSEYCCGGAGLGISRCLGQRLISSPKRQMSLQAQGNRWMFFTGTTTPACSAPRWKCQNQEGGWWTAAGSVGLQIVPLGGCQAAAPRGRARLTSLTAGFLYEKFLYIK